MFSSNPGIYIALFWFVCLFGFILQICMHILSLINCAFDSPVSGMKVAIPHNILKSEKKQKMNK